MEVAEGLVGAGMSPTEALQRLEDIRNDAEAAVEEVGRKFMKLQQSLDENNSVWQTILTGSEELKPQRLKSYNQKTVEIDKLIEALKLGKGPLDRVTRRIAAIPGEVKLHKTVASTIEEINQQVSAARLSLRSMPTLIKTFGSLKEKAALALA